MSGQHICGHSIFLLNCFYMANERIDLLLDYLLLHAFAGDGGGCLNLELIAPDRHGLARDLSSQGDHHLRSWSNW